MSRTIKVRIAVAVDPTGGWASGGFSNAAPNTAMDIAIECLQPGERRYWLEAELEVPEVQTITVQPTTPEDPK